MGFRRAARYAGHRVARLPDSPGAIAGGLAWGAAASFTPFIGLQFLLALLGAWATRCNLVASAIGTAIGNPWTFPFIWAAIYQTGAFMLGEEPAAEPPLGSLARLFALLWRLAGEGVGRVVGLGGEPAAADSWREVAALAEAVLWPMTVGCAPYAAATWLVFYFVGRRALAAYRGRREGRLRARREKAGAPGGDVPNI
jgi:uncharacterized protein (DUF2062 family)